MGQTEHLVNIRGHDLRITGDDADGLTHNLPRVVHEAVLEYAAAVLPRDATVLDLGANLGWVAAGFALIVDHGTVVAVEASPTTFAHLEHNMRAAGLQNVTLINAAASDTAGTLEFFDNEWFSAGSFVKESTLAAEVHVGAVKVPAVTVDELVAQLSLDRVDFIKIDIEGHELPALRGARDTLERFRPSAMIEMNLFTTTSFGNTLPLDFLSEICAVFPYVYDYRFDVGLFPIASEADMYGRVQSQFISGLPTDLICRFDPLPDDARDALAAALSAVPAPDPTEVDLGHTREALARTQRALAIAEDKVRALEGSTSWKMTAPARWMSDRVRALRAHRRGVNG